MRRLTLGGLAVRLLGGPDGDGGGDGPLVVLCHGFGAPGDDLVALAGALGAARAVRFAFPAAPLDLGPAYGGGRAWWPLDLERMMRERAAGRPRDPRTEDPPGLAGARGALAEVLERLATPGAPLVLGGFSQGAMLACDLALRDARALSALVVLSGSFLAADAWRAGMAARAGLPVFQSHGRDDELLPFAIAEALCGELWRAGVPVQFVGFDGGHEIPPVVLDGLRGFLARACARR